MSRADVLRIADYLQHVLEGIGLTLKELISLCDVSTM